MARKLLAYGLLLITILWLVASYLPEHVLLLPKTSLDGLISVSNQRTVFYVIMAVFVLIQASLVVSTNRLFMGGGMNEKNEDKQAEAGSRVALFGLRRGPELLWTSVPLIMTLITLFWVVTVVS